MIGRYAWVLALSMASIEWSGCSTPERQGPHVPGLPNGFAYDGNLASARVVFPDRDLKRQRGYSTFGEPHCSVVISEFDGPTTEAKAGDARADLKSRYGYLDYGPLETLRIDGRPAWGWLETQHYQGELASLEYKAVVAYDDVTYTVEFFAADPEFRDEDFLRESVSRFEIGRTKVNEAAVVSGFVMAAGFVCLMIWTGKRK